MSYQNLEDNNQGGYGQYNPYGAQQNPYGAQQQQQPQQGYGYGGGYGQAGAMEQGNGGYEMNNMQQVPDKNALLTRINELKQGIEDVKRKRTTQLRAAQAALLESNTAKEDQVTRQNVDYIEDEINTALRYLRDQLKRIADTPGCGTAGPAEHYTIAKKGLQDEITAYQGDQSNFHKRLEEQVRRRYQMANPEATPDQLEAGVQAVMQGQEQAFMTPGTRSRQANDARQATLARSAAIRKIEKDMADLAQLFTDVQELVIQQEPAVTQIQQGAEETHRNVQQANTKLDSAITSARNARRWKWYALIIVIIIIAIVVGVAVGVTEANKSSK
ncbi:uncharacterized protein N7473_006648 [Penicillium subrubescens]|uniref:Protein SSO2 n=1 Tax=Penicillium subrubescens TaxID=1316194 RepID=A0A1Q5SWM9_9EURO|nr:uncharacterized protein N7473_006648 [Penicillium subrubescens]KAJ5890420.1 hypothetical protein N7473_006648 [Penicillium subrubescens]OKO92306.1 Protein SSO2 [Penicillium subrubescens]